MKIDLTQAQVQREQLPPVGIGNHVVKITKVGRTDRKFSYIIECKVVESDVEKLVGTSGVVCIHRIEKAPSVYVNKLANFLCAAYGLDPFSESSIAQLDSEYSEACLAPNWSQLGTKLRLNVHQRTTQNGVLITENVFSPVAE